MAKRLGWTQKALAGLRDVINLADADANADEGRYPREHPIWLALQTLDQMRWKETVAVQACMDIMALLEEVDQRCLVADGPVTPTRLEITDAEMHRIYKLANKGADHA